MAENFFFIFLFILGGFLMLTVILGIAKILRPQKPSEEKGATYESGEETEGSAFVSFNIRFYVIAIIFLLFEVELVFLFPWGIVFGDEALIAESEGQWAWYAISEMFIFIFVLALGLLYAWREGHLDWVKPDTSQKKFESKVPLEAYKVINEKYR
ncbi:NADH-quinone oxidoreductase subunit A [Marinilongibacter aquaticus]|uniref:NADH-quinone oxidoreductase subunit A n=1 Tax=Marinilongibacter aquaticus TaxID=2975157 RepID=UPI0021BD869B|nr:NADH-quinone oxidoreductase subunit A [Marinilongibacter aquaticus]UBM57261.1 NADH-quinone oxidoreductase subunit A [Marinilongibacter aquaticus]